MPTGQIDNLKFVSGLDSSANALTRRAFTGADNPGDADAIARGYQYYSAGCTKK